MNDLYETKISDARWWAYDIPGNIGWITYITVMVRLFRNPPAYMKIPLVMSCLIVGILPAIAMAVGIFELISERIVKLDRVLPRKRLLRGFMCLVCRTNFQEFSQANGGLIWINNILIQIKMGFMGPVIPTKKEPIAR